MQAVFFTRIPEYFSVSLLVVDKFSASFWKARDRVIIKIGNLDATITLPEDYKPKCTPGIILTHGASGDHHMDQLLRIAEAFANAGYVCLRFTCKASALQQRVDAFKRVLEEFEEGGRYPVSKCLLAGRSMGARAAVQCANQLDKPIVVGVVCFAYPLHPPGNKNSLRSQLLLDLRKPTLLISGTKDAMCDLELLRKILDKKEPKELITLVTIDGADHGYKVKGGKAAVEACIRSVCTHAVEWARPIVGGEIHDAVQTSEDAVASSPTKKRKAPAEDISTTSKRRKTVNSR